RHVREHPDPHPPGALHLARDGAPRRLDLTRSDALRLERLEPERAERQLAPRRRHAVDAALELLAEFGADWLQHGGSRFLSSRRRLTRCTPGGALVGA